MKRLVLSEFFVPYKSVIHEVLPKRPCFVDECLFIFFQGHKITEVCTIAHCEPTFSKKETGWYYIKII